VKSARFSSGVRKGFENVHRLKGLASRKTALQLEENPHLVLPARIVKVPITRKLLVNRLLISLISSYHG
jgi:hypothetical protein